MNNQILIRGLIAGLIGATVIALLFFAIDLAQGTPLATPGHMAEALLGTPGSAGVPAYTILHYMSFLIMGMATAWSLHHLGNRAPLPIGLALGGMLFAFIFYGSILFNGPDVISIVGWPSMLVVNLAAGVAMVWFCRKSAKDTETTWIESVLAVRWFREGLLLGISTSVLVAVWMLLVDTITGEPFFTAGALGSAMVLGAADATQIQVNATTVLGYTLYHVIIFTAIAMAVEWGATQAGRAPSVVIAGMLLFVVFEALTAGLIALVANFLLGATAWWGILGGNLLAASWLAWHISRRHPEVGALLGRTELSSETS